jgi:U3 small nucleolar RNA-associated protein 18
LRLVSRFIIYLPFLNCFFLQIHLPTLTSFSNWPTSSTPLGHVSAIDFSAQSEYVAVGNTRGKVLLYHLVDYGASRVFM